MPKPTNDLATAKYELSIWGFCFLKDAQDPQRVEALSNDLRDICAYEREQGIAQLESQNTVALETDAAKKGLLAHDAVNQRVWGLFHKGQRFRELLKHEEVLWLSLLYTSPSHRDEEE